MSYWVHLEINTGAGNYADVYERNMTSNVAPMWRKAGADIAEMNGKTATDCTEMLSAAINTMRAEPTTYEAMNPANRWGDYAGCIDFLTDLRDACVQHPDCIVRVSH
jgi:hypothetical protein